MSTGDFLRVFRIKGAEVLVLLDVVAGIVVCKAGMKYYGLGKDLPFNLLGGCAVCVPLLYAILNFLAYRETKSTSDLRGVIVGFSCYVVLLLSLVKIGYLTW